MRSQLMPMQFEMDELLNMICISMRTASIRWLVSSTSNVNPMSISGITGSFIRRMTCTIPFHEVP
jgi:hypothetical protein